MKAGEGRQGILTNKVPSLAWHEVGDDSGSNTKQEIHAKKHLTSITCLLPSVGRRLAHQPATGSVARRKNIRWDAEQEE